jgi:molybdate transport system substrate-binding protein
LRTVFELLNLSLYQNRNKGTSMKLTTLLFSLVATVSFAWADTANIAAASDLQYAFKEMQSLCAKKYPTERINLAVGNVKPYALGRIGLMTLKSSNIPVNLSILATDRIKKIAIANPEHAPYGQAAVAALKTLGLYDKVKYKFVFGENIQQATQYVQTGAADVGIIALSIAKAPIIADQENFLANS